MEGDVGGQVQGEGKGQAPRPLEGRAEQRPGQRPPRQRFHGKATATVQATGRHRAAADALCLLRCLRAGAAL